MIRDGKALEEFVAQVEREAAMPDAKVTCNVKKYGDDAKQIAEFDIVVEGRFGTIDMKWLIECRDRPSEGPAPNSWIEQLIGRRQRHKFDRVTAVSTTGFASGCAEAALDARIELRTVREVIPERFAHWFRPTEVECNHRLCRLDGADVFPDWGGGPDRTSQLLDVLKRGAEEVLLWSERNQWHLHFREALLSVVNEKDLWGVLVGEERKTLTIEAAYKDDDRYSIDVAGEPVQIKEIRFRGEIWIERTFVPVERVEYAKDACGEVLAQKASFQFSLDESTASIEIVKVGAEGPSQLRAKMLD